MGSLGRSKVLGATTLVVPPSPPGEQAMTRNHTAHSCPRLMSTLPRSLFAPEDDAAASGGNTRAAPAGVNVAASTCSVCSAHPNCRFSLSFRDDATLYNQAAAAAGTRDVKQATHRCLHGELMR